MSAICIYKWKIKLIEFGFTSNDEFETLKRCGLEVNVIDSSTILRMVVLLEYPQEFMPQDIREGIVKALKTLSDGFNLSSTVKKIFDTVQNHVERYEPIDMISKEYPFIDDDYRAEFMKEVGKEFLRNVREFVHGIIQDNGTTYQYKSSYDSGSSTYNPQSSMNYAKIVDRSKEENLDRLKSIRTVDKIVKYNDNNWKVNYTISMNANETYTHKLEICDYNDIENKTSVTINTDSHFIKALDERIKTAIKELENNLWTIDRFEKWGGDLSG